MVIIIRLSHLLSLAVNSNRTGVLGADQPAFSVSQWSLKLSYVYISWASSRGFVM